MDRRAVLREHPVSDRRRVLRVGVAHDFGQAAQCPSAPVRFLGLLDRSVDGGTHGISQKTVTHSLPLYPSTAAWICGSALIMRSGSLHSP